MTLYIGQIQQAIIWKKTELTNRVAVKTGEKGGQRPDWEQKNCFQIINAERLSAWGSFQYLHGCIFAAVTGETSDLSFKILTLQYSNTINQRCIHLQGGSCLDRDDSALPVHCIGFLISLFGENVYINLTYLTYALLHPIPLCEGQPGVGVQGVQHHALNKLRPAELNL